MLHCAKSLAPSLSFCLSRFHNQYIRVPDPADGRYRDYSQYPYTWTHDMGGFPMNNSVALHDEGKRQDKVTTNISRERDAAKTTV